MSKLLYYKLRSPYEGDVTKNCKLTVEDLDSNFLSLKKDDIKGAYLDGTDIVLERTGGNNIVIDASSLAAGTKVAYDKKNGIIKFGEGDDSETIEGLVTVGNIAELLNGSQKYGVYTNATMAGDGAQRRPIGISPVELTGMYKPAKSILDIVDGEELPKADELRRGDRFVTKEEINPYGFLYDFKGVHKIMHDLNHGWRVPSKEDWDDMLNAVEPCEEYRNHGEKIGNHILGKYAGKFLKTEEGWDETDVDDPFDDNGEHQYPHGRKDGKKHPKVKLVDPSGTDSYGFSAMPSGFSDGDMMNGYFGKRSYFWTSSMDNVTDVYVKRFDNNKSGVVQIIENPHNYYSIRLVKDYDGHNFTGSEHVNGQTFLTVLMPSLEAESGFRIWTIDNVAFPNEEYSPKNPISDDSRIMSIGYFINHWDGFKWYKKRLSEGEKIVITDEDDYPTYMMLDGELVKDSSSATVSVKQIEAINKRLEELSELISENEDGIAAINGQYTELSDKIQDNSDKLSKIDDIVKTLSGESTKTIDDLKANVVIGGKYDNEKGELTLVKDGADNVVIQFSGDYGVMKP